MPLVEGAAGGAVLLLVVVPKVTMDFKTSEPPMERNFSNCCGDILIPNSDKPRYKSWQYVSAENIISATSKVAGHAQKGGALSIEGGGKAVITESTFEGFAASISGGAIYANQIYVSSVKEPSW